MSSRVQLRDAVQVRTKTTASLGSCNTPHGMVCGLAAYSLTCNASHIMAGSLAAAHRTAWLGTHRTAWLGTHRASWRATHRTSWLAVGVFTVHHAC